MAGVCSEPGCPQPAVYRGRCAGHGRARAGQIHRAGTRLYKTKRWRMTRRRYLFTHPICEHPDGCDRIATDVHHDIDLAAGGDAWSSENLVALCKSHHSQITRARQLLS